MHAPPGLLTLTEGQRVSEGERDMPDSQGISPMGKPSAHPAWALLCRAWGGVSGGHCYGGVGVAGISDALS